MMGIILYMIRIYKVNLADIELKDVLKIEKICFDGVPAKR